MTRRKMIAGNWKMNNTAAEGAELVAAIAASMPSTPAANAPEVVVCPPFTTLAAVVAKAAGTGIAVGAQNVHWAASGAFTGEISATMLKSLPVTHVLVGHSERRQYFGETDATVNQRTRAALAEGLTVIVCVGETLAEREDGSTMAVVERQVRHGLEGVTEAEMQQIVIAYEPVWAIGTGKVATDEQAQEVHASIRKTLGAMYSDAVAGATRILYGGSMNPTNAAGLLAQPDIDGGLIGGAALKAADFTALIAAAAG